MRVYLYIIISAFLGLPAFQPIERALEKRLLKAGSVEEARVRIFAWRLGFILGFLRKVEIEVRGLMVGGLRTDLFSVEAHKMRIRTFHTFVMNKARVTGAGDVMWKLKILDEDLEKFVQRKGPLLSRAQVRIDGDSVTIHRAAGIASIFSINETFTVRGRLKLSEKKDVLLELDHFSAFGISPGKPLRSTLMALINPIIKAKDINRMLAKNQIEMLENLTPRTYLEEISLETGHAVIYGTVSLEKTKEKSDTGEQKPKTNNGNGDA